ncbi:MAG: hypothetical protein ACI350_04610 [Prevotella sp.]
MKEKLFATSATAFAAFFAKVRATLFSYILSFVLAVSLFGCAENGFYQGDLSMFSCVDDEVRPQADSVALAKPHSQFFAVYDTLAMVYIPGLDGYSFEIYNIQTGDLMGSFFPHGHGHGEFLCVEPVGQMFLENGQLTAIIAAFNEQKLLRWNITQSVAQGRTVYSESPLQDDENGISHSHCTEIGRDSVLAFRHCETMSVNGQTHVVEPVWKILDRPTGKLLDELHEFRFPEIHEGTKVMPELFSQDFPVSSPTVRGLWRPCIVCRKSVLPT